MAEVKTYKYVYTYMGLRIASINENAFTRRKLPVTLDSLCSTWNNKRAPIRDQYETLPHMPTDSCVIKRHPAGYADHFLTRVYHAWLVLTNRAGAYQFASDHYAIANKRKMYYFRSVDITEKEDDTDE